MVSHGQEESGPVRIEMFSGRFTHKAALLLLQYAKHPYDRVLLLEEENELG